MKTTSQIKGKGNEERNIDKGAKDLSNYHQQKTEVNKAYHGHRDQKASKATCLGWKCCTRTWVARFSCGSQRKTIGESNSTSNNSSNNNQQQR